KQLEKEVVDAHVASMMAEVERLSLELSDQYEEIDSLLEATLAVDDYVDLEILRPLVEYPAFPRPDLQVPTPPREAILDPPEPTLQMPEPPKGLKKLLGKKRQQRVEIEAMETHRRETEDWHSSLEEVEASRQRWREEYAQLEAVRLAELEQADNAYAHECATIKAKAVALNADIDELINNLGYGAPDAVDEYVSIVLSNSVYPDHFPVAHTFTFDASTAELNLVVLVPGPDKVPSIKAYKYVKASDEITTTQLSQKACKDRYAAAVHQVSIRSIHEVFEADRRGIVKTISLELGTQTINPATGTETYLPFVAVCAARESFLEFDLSAIVPPATLEHLGASVSKNPYGLVAADTSGIRRA
ncbi:MAG: hypothetical protein ACKVKH_18275, partial [Verrucomicrobiales bacterium]